MSDHATGVHDLIYLINEYDALLLSYTNLQTQAGKAVIFFEVFSYKIIVFFLLNFLKFVDIVLNEFEYFVMFYFKTIRLFFFQIE